MSLKEKGFTLIELLVIVSIIALLSTVLMTSLSGYKNRARDVSFQSTVKSIQKGAGICCTADNGEIQNADMDADICDPACGSIWPGAANIGSVEITRNCSSIEGYMLRIYPGTTNVGGIDHADCDRDDCVYTYN